MSLKSRMAKKHRPQAIQERATRTAAAMATPAGGVVQPPKKKTNPAQFAREVRAEARKITWTSRRETWITSVMVAIMVMLAALFFLATNTVISWGITQILKLASGG
jgi:preprotein translocase subunit SecE